MPLKDTYTSVNETGCCPVPHLKNWDGTVESLADRPFIKKESRSFLHIPLGYGRVLASLRELAVANGATLPDKQAMTLSRDLSPWRSEVLYGVNKPVKGANNVALEGKYLSKVFEGPYEAAKKWHGELSQLAQEKGAKGPEVYFFYTTCPKCAKHYGKNYTIGFARVS